MTELSLSDIENAFQPTREIDSAERFAGRKHRSHCCSLNARWDGSRPSSEKYQRGQKAGTNTHSSASSAIR